MKFNLYFGFLKYFFIFTVLFASFPIQASLPQPKLHPIEAKEQACRKNAPDTVSLVDCTDTAIKEWDDELNSIYKKNMDKLHGDLKNDLKISQRAWLQQRDKEFQLYNKIYQKAEGTISGITYAGQIRDFIKHRVQTLYQIFESDDYSGDSSSGYLFWKTSF